MEAVEGWTECVFARQTWPDLLMGRSRVLEKRRGEGGGRSGGWAISDGLWPATWWRASIF